MHAMKRGADAKLMRTPPSISGASGARQTQHSGMICEAQRRSLFARVPCILAGCQFGAVRTIEEVGVQGHLLLQDQSEDCGQSATTPPSTLFKTHSESLRAGFLAAQVVSNPTYHTAYWC